MDLINTVFAAILGAIQNLALALTQFALPILFITAVISWYWQGGWDLAFSPNGGLGEALAGGLSRIIVVGIVMFILVRWQDLTTAIVETMIFWGTAGGSTVDPAELLRSPGVVWTIGQQAAAPIAQYDTWARGLASTWNLIVNPLDLISYLAILAAFLTMTLSHGMILLETNLCIAFGAVLVPWMFLRPVGHLAEFLIGWFTGCCIRMLVSVALMTIAMPQFEMLKMPAAAGGGGWWDSVRGLFVPTVAPAFTDTLATLGIALLFLLLTVIVPRAAARLAGTSLGLSGHDIIAGAVGLTRFAMMATSVSSRVISPMLSR